MRGERLFRILGLVDEDLIEEAAPASSAAAGKRRSGAVVWRRTLAAAACLTVVCALAWVVGGGLRPGAETAGAPSEGGMGGGSGHGAGTTFMSYAGPVFPLSVLEGDAPLTAERALTWDFAPGTYEDGTPRQWGAAVTDAYTLTNPTEAAVSVTALYPFAGSLSELAALRPGIAVDGVPAETALVTGPYAGGFRGTGGDDGSTWNLLPPTGWEDYQQLLEDGTYLERALAPRPVPDLPVTVYEFTDFQAPHGDHPAATQAVEFTIDEARTTVLSYGFEGMGWDEETGWRQYSFFVPDGQRRSASPKLLAVLGDDIGDYALRGWADGGCEEEIGGVSCAVTRTETTLAAVLDRLCRDYLAQYAGETAITARDSMDLLPPGLFPSAAAELLTRYGPLAETPTDRYGDGRLDDLLGEALSVQRVLYLAFPVTVPAGGSVTVTAALWKAPSYDFGGSGSENVGVQGFDLATKLGSVLTFTRQTAALEHPETMEIVRQNLGFDPEAGVTRVELDPAEPHYYLEIRPLAEDG